MGIVDRINSFGIGGNIIASGPSNPASAGGRVTAPPPRPSGLSAFLGGVAHSVDAGIHALPALGNALIHPIVRTAEGVNQLVNGGRIENSFKVRQQSIQTAQQSLLRQRASGRFQGAEGKARFDKQMRDIQKESESISSEHRNTISKYMGPGEFASNVAQTAAMALPVGDLYAGAKAAITGAKVTKAESLAKALLAGNAKAPGLGEVAGKAISVPTNVVAVQAGAAIPGEVQHGDYGGAALNTAALASPLLARGISAVAPKIASAAKNAFVDTHGLFDGVKIAGGKSVNDALAEAQATMKPAAYNRTVNILKVAQENMLAEAGGNMRVAQAKLDHEMGAVLGKRSLDQQNLQTFTKDLGDLHYSRRIANAPEGRAAIQVADKQAPTGYRPLNDNEVVTVTRADNVKKAALTKDLVATAGDTQAQRGVLRQYSDVLKNRNFRAAVDNVLTQAGGDAAKIKAGMKEIRSAKAVQVAEGGPKPRNGYEYTIAPKGAVTPKLPSEVGDIVQGKKAPMGFVGRAVDKAGLSPAATDPKEVFNHLRGNFASNLPEDLSLNSDKIFNKLSEAARLRNVNDARLLRRTEIKNALGSGFSMSDAKVIEKAVRKSYSQLPASLTGAGGKLLNKTLSVPFGGKAQAQYLRAEQAGRYGRGNIFFTGKQISKAAIINLFQGGKFRAANPDSEAALEEIGKFSKSKIDQGISDLLSSDEHMKIGGDINQVVRPIKSMMAGMAEAVAAKEGKTVREVLADEGSPLNKELNHAVDTIIGYPKDGYINSPLAKTLNVAIFPSRFDTKVAMAAGKAFGKMNPVAQMGVVASTIKGAQWLGTPEGKKWQKDNSELLGVLKYFTPLQTVGEVAHILGGKGGGGVADLGSVGGLPFGVISTILDHQGIDLGPLKSSQFYDPKTGQPVPTNIPITDKARVQQAFTDFIGSMFSYPGATIGLTSKTKLIQAAGPLKPGKGETKPQLKDGSSPKQAKQSQQDTLKALKGGKPVIQSGAKIFVGPTPPIPPKKSKAKSGGRPKFHAKPIPQKLS